MIMFRPGMGSTHLCSLSNQLDSFVSRVWGAGARSERSDLAGGQRTNVEVNESSRNLSVKAWFRQLPENRQSICLSIPPSSHSKGL